MALLYFHSNTCISPQQSFPVANFSEYQFPANNKLQITEPDYAGIPAGILRRMGKAIRLGIGAALPLVKDEKFDGIIIGTANGGMEDCIRFLNQIIEYDEGRLTPGNFVASTSNAIASQLGLMLQNKGYNNTHVQSGLSFENALLDAALLLKENNQRKYLVGGVDEISAYNYNIDKLYGWYKKEITKDFYTATVGTIPGEGAAMFTVSASQLNAKAALTAIDFFHTDDAAEVAIRLEHFLEKNKSANAVDLFLTGDNGDIRYNAFYESWKTLPVNACTAHYKHLCGEYATSSAFAVWLALQTFEQQQLPYNNMLVSGNMGAIKTILIVNHYKENQHSFMLLNAQL